MLTFENREYLLQAGDFFVLSPYSMHYVNHIGEKHSFCCEYLYMKPAELLQNFYPLDIPKEMHWYRNSDCPFIFSKASHPHIHRLLMLLLKEYHSRMRDYQLVVKGLAQTLMAELTQELADRTTESPDKFRHISTLLPALTALAAFHPCRAVSLKHLNLPRPFSGTVRRVPGQIFKSAPTTKGMRATLQYGAVRFGDCY